MFKHILVPTDGSELSAKAVKQAIRLAKSVGAKLSAINVTPAYPNPVAYGEVSARVPDIVRKHFHEESAVGSKKILDQVKADAIAAGVDCFGVSVHKKAPYEAIIKQAKETKCDLIVMASHGRGSLSSILLGSETAKVLTHSRIPVLVVR